MAKLRCGRVRIVSVTDRAGTAWQYVRTVDARRNLMMWLEHASTFPDEQAECVGLLTSKAVGVVMR